MNKKEFKDNIFSLSEHLYPMVSRILGKNENVEDAIQEIMMKNRFERNDGKGK